MILTKLLILQFLVLLKYYSTFHVVETNKRKKWRFIQLRFCSLYLLVNSFSISSFLLRRPFRSNFSHWGADFFSLFFSSCSRFFAFSSWCRSASSFIRSSLRPPHFLKILSRPLSSRIIGVPANPKNSRIRFSIYRRYEKWKWLSLLTDIMNFGGFTSTWEP